MKFFGIYNYKCLYSNDVIKENCPQKFINESKIKSRDNNKIEPLDLVKDF